MVQVYQFLCATEVFVTVAVGLCLRLRLGLELLGGCTRRESLVYGDEGEGVGVVLFVLAAIPWKDV